MSKSPLQHVEWTIPVNTPGETSGTQTNSPGIAGTTRNLPPQPKTGKGGKKKSSQNVQTEHSHS